MRPIPSLALIALLSAGAAQAMTEDTFHRLDADGDGVISREEFLDLRRMMFAMIDTDSSGTLTDAEIAAARESASRNIQMRADKRIWDQDANGDGELSLAEYTAQTRGFDFADRNDDGALSQDEFNRIARFLKSFRP
ncbi:EF-hand domain-containing protein [Actibacterium ureilyticum]|uniref:EF-hand domain-containing protein n=1 Tax=Actibacterium ureilyticum TaxID=1590614 RepID=UPI0015963AF4|nr:EF-hand domain-containing protein [Actibacterium ureilyticum]